MEARKISLGSNLRKHYFIGMKSIFKPIIINLNFILKTPIESSSNI